ncbi:hypothetical protein VTN02DRAFT_6841 [Thermoascus thermophilus]
MPAIYQPLVVPVRELHADEEFVLAEFERHASRCSRCADPWRVHKEGGTLCDRGHQYAIDVASYIYSRNGKAYSVVEREHNVFTLVKIPSDCQAVRGLLRAMEDGLRVHRKENPKAQPPVISYDKTYPVAARVPTLRPETEKAIIERTPQGAKHRHTIVYRSPRTSPARDSLYESDRTDRVERRYESWRLHRPARYFR